MANQTPREYLIERLQSERDLYQKQADRLRTERSQRDWQRDQEAIAWSEEFVKLSDTLLRVLGVES